MEYEKKTLQGSVWVITEKGHDYTKPMKGITFAFDTETQVYLDGKILETKKLARKIKNMNDEEKRKRISNITWAWQCYDEFNGFFMTNDFETFLTYICACGFKFGHCYNSTFDFAQIDYEILAKGKDKWKPHEHVEKGSGKAYNKGQPYTYESLHNDMGARYAYKIWFPYRNADRHTYCHAFELHDFMKLLVGGLRRVLEDLDVTDNEGKPIRKLTMEYQAVDTNNLTQAEIDYCAVDVKGLYFAVKKFNDEIERQSNGESHIFGEETNVMTAGGFAKRELLRSLYPNMKPRFRLERFQKQHPLTKEQDEYLRKNYLYRGGISYVNPVYKGVMLTAAKMGEPMRRYDVNSEYPFAMSQIRDLIGKPIKKRFEEYLSMKDKDEYEAVYILQSVTGIVKQGYLGLWYDPFKRDYVDVIDERGTHLMFEREFNEMQNWYDDFEFEIEDVLLWKKGDRVYAPFVNENYALKAQAKREKNATLQTTAKLKINSSYGKLSERLERVKGHYELNEKTGAIHFVSDETEISMKSAMNVAIGALITSYARVFILSKIREVCGNEIRKRFVYIDTDSIHAFADYDKADAYALGGLKLEATCEAVKYILPKTYVDIERINKDGTIDFDKMEIHSKGVSISAVKASLKKKQKGKKRGLPTLALMDSKIAYGQKYLVLCAMNVRGGKVLLPVEKYLATKDRQPTDNDERIVYTNYAGIGYLQER